MKNAKILSFINYKGGVAKTTSTYHVGCWLAGQKNKNVLLIDVDPQTNLTFLCASIEDWKQRRTNVGTIADVYKRFLDGKPIDAKRYVWKTPIRLRDDRRLPRLDLLPCDLELIGEDVGGGQIACARPRVRLWWLESPRKRRLRRNAAQFLHKRTFLARTIDEVRDEYDYVLIDCPPDLYLMTQNALAASHQYVVTAIPDHLSTIGLNVLIQEVDKLERRARQAAALSGEQSQTQRFAKFGAVLFVRVRMTGQTVTTAHASKMEELRNGSLKCFKTCTTELIGYTEAAENSLPVWMHDSDNARNASQKQEYPKIVDELLETF